MSVENYQSMQELSEKIQMMITLHIFCFKKGYYFLRKRANSHYKQSIRRKKNSISSEI